MASKLSLLAERAKTTRTNWDKRADELMQGMDALDKRADVVFDKHHGALAVAEAGFKEMEDAVRDLEGGNNPPKDTEDSSHSGDASFQASTPGNG